jgi:hypothetical protein
LNKIDEKIKSMSFIECRVNITTIMDGNLNEIDNVGEGGHYREVVPVLTSIICRSVGATVLFEKQLGT